MNLTPGKLWGMRRMADSQGIFKMTAVDQRPPIKSLISSRLGTDSAPWDEVSKFKALLVETLQEQSTAMLLDPHYAIPGSLDMLSPTKGLIVTLEDSICQQSDGGRISANIDNWSVSKIKRMGADAVKLLVWYRPDAPASVCQRQKDYAKKVGEECARNDIAFLLEMLVYPLDQDAATGSREYLEMDDKKADTVLASVDTFAAADYGVDLFKLESPVNSNKADGSASTQALFDEMGRLAGRPWVMLSAGADKASFSTLLSHAFQAGCSGFLAGRAIWFDAFKLYPDWHAMKQALSTEAIGYMKEISDMADSQASRWNTHPYYGETGAIFSQAHADFRKEYQPLCEEQHQE